MKVFLLGGYGAVGLPSAKLLVESELVSEITLAGRSVERGQQAVAEIGDKVKAVQVDGADEKQLASLVAGYDIIVNSASNQVALPALHAAVRAGAHYCDVGWGQDFIAQMNELAAEARDAGITAIICTGISPCITNLMGVHAANQLDVTEQLQGGRSWVFQGARTLTPQQWLENPEESLAVLHEFKNFLEWMLEVAQQTESRTVRTYQDGRWVDVDPLTSGLQAPLPQGGTVTAYPYGSYDPLFDSLPQDLARVRPVEVWFTPFPPQLHDLFREQALRVAAGNVDPATAVSSFYKTVENDPDRWLTGTNDVVAFSPDWVTAVGRKEGRAARFNCWLAPALWNEQSAWFLTSVPLAVAVLRILSGEARERGVMTAEKAFEPLSFFDEVVALLPEPPPDEKLIGESFEWLE
ncbi:MAG: saccharopine dehydrogenase NADP-binding domain-containing protein [Anaerolineales bacterium]|nr:saccharopine dehydrogenase NADP-binding domain-containing protein [Anaerolineales bacterium]